MGRQPYPWLNPGLVAGALVPLLAISWRARTGALGANPVAIQIPMFVGADTRPTR